MGSANLLHSLLPLVASLGVVLVLKGLLGGFGTATLPVRPMPLMTPTERRTLDYIEAALPWARIHAQVSMGAIMAPKTGLNRSKAATVRNRFSSKRIDYVVEDRDDGTVVMLIELDDRSHRPDQDARRDRMTRAAGYFTLRLPASEKPTAQSVRCHLAVAFEQQPQLRLFMGQGQGRIADRVWRWRHWRRRRRAAGDTRTRVAGGGPDLMLVHETELSWMLSRLDVC